MVNDVKQSSILAAHLTCNAAMGARPENAEFRSGCALGSAMLRWNLTTGARKIWPILSNRVWLRMKCAKCTKCTQRVGNPRTHGSETRERRQLCTRVRSAMLDTGANASLFGKCQSKFWQWLQLLCQAQFWQWIRLLGQSKFWQWRVLLYHIKNHNQLCISSNYVKTRSERHALVTATLLCIHTATDCTQNRLVVLAFANRLATSRCCGLVSQQLDVSQSRCSGSTEALYQSPSISLCYASVASTLYQT